MNGRLRSVRVTINEKVCTFDVEPRLLLVDLIRERAGLHGTHVGCDTGNCGACTVLMDGVSVKSCQVLAVRADGAEIATVEGLAPPGALHPIQEAFWECDAVECGFCTSGMLMTGLALLRNNPDPNEEEIRLGFKGNLCRCTGYLNIIAAVRRAAEKLRAQGARA